MHRYKVQRALATDIVEADAVSFEGGALIFYKETYDREAGISTLTDRSLVKAYSSNNWIRVEPDE